MNEQVGVDLQRWVLRKDSTDCSAPGEAEEQGRSEGAARRPTAEDHRGERDESLPGGDVLGEGDRRLPMVRSAPARPATHPPSTTFW